MNALYKLQALRRRRSLGFVTSYLLYGIALVSAMGLAFGKMYVEKEQGRIIQDNLDELVTQVDVLRGKVLLCAAIYPEGTHGEFAVRPAYPAPPATDNFRAPINTVTCPGSPGAAYNLAQLGDGVPLPRVLPEFEPWVYEHTEAEGIKLILQPKVAGGGEAIRNRLLRKLGSVAAASGDNVVITLLN